MRDSRDVRNERDVVGGSVQRLIAAQSDHAAFGEVFLALRRPWQKREKPAEELRLKYDLRGKEEGLPRAIKRQAFAA